MPIAFNRDGRSLATQQRNAGRRRLTASPPHVERQRLEESRLTERQMLVASLRTADAPSRQQTNPHKDGASRLGHAAPGRN